ncbi:MAG: phosphoenolpyruvate carboxylase [Flavobacteriaceae bacterium]
MARKPKIERFNEKVLSKFHIYNSLFLTLPFKSIKNTSILLPLFTDHCKTGFNSDKSPKIIVESFFEKHLPNINEKDKNDLLFRFIQFIERQVVLFDAIEDAAFPYVNNMHGRGTLRYIKEEAYSKQNLDELIRHLNKFKLRIVLTAHPTQFYPDNVLVIINELSKSIAKDDLDKTKTLLAQLGKTPFYKKEKPTPFDEAISLIWYLENVFYNSAPIIYNYIEKNLKSKKFFNNPVFDFGFWPGGDRDGNPFVTHKTTLNTAKRLRFSIIRNYYRDLRKLRKKLTFREVENKVQNLEEILFSELFNPGKNKNLNPNFLIGELEMILEILFKVHEGLYSEDVKDLIHKLKLFGFYFASLDIRQDSRIHDHVFNDIINTPDLKKYVADLPKKYSNLNLKRKYSLLSKIQGDIPVSIFENELTKKTLSSIRIIKKIQSNNGEKGCNRYIISNCKTLENILQLFALHRICNWKEPSVDFIPLFESIKDLANSPNVLEELFSNTVYLNHLKRRKNKQTVMLGFSDGTKDGGYFMANWSIYKAKENLSKIAKKYKIEISFFDGRGGPPARGGGNTHQFYASMGSLIQANEIQLTIQGQTISSNFGTVNSAQFNLEQLLSSGISNITKDNSINNLNKKDRKILDFLADNSFKEYKNFKNHPKFLSYLENMSTLPYYSKTNIGSRPSKRSNSSSLIFSDLRAIPFVGSWSQLKQNVPGFFGVGSAIEELNKKGEIKSVKKLFKNSLFFRTLVFNSMMSLTKSFFELTSYMESDKEYGAFWKLIYNEFLLTKKMLLKISGFKELMQNEPAGKASIKAREEIVQPLLTIQQFALIKIKEIEKTNDYSKKEIKTLKSLVTRSLFGNINASRNSA